MLVQRVDSHRWQQSRDKFTSFKSTLLTHVIAYYFRALLRPSAVLGRLTLSLSKQTQIQSVF